jgi:hypothetical protein
MNALIFLVSIKLPLVYVKSSILLIFFMIKSWKQSLAELQGNAAYIRSKVVKPFPGPYASGSYMH